MIVYEVVNLLLMYIFRVVAQVYELYGTQQLLLGSLSTSEKALKHAIELQPLPAGLDTALKLSSLFIEQDAMQQATALYLQMCAAFKEEESTPLAWILIHRVGLWLVRYSLEVLYIQFIFWRDESGKYTQSGFDSAKQDLEKAIALTKGSLWFSVLC